jgi:hypothetical protein
VNPELEAALTAIRTIEEKIEGTEQTQNRSKLYTLLLILAPAFLIAGIVLLILTFQSTGSLLKDVLITVATFLIVLGAQGYCVMTKSNQKIERGIKDLSKSFCKSVERLITKEKHLRKLDHTFRMLILIDTLKVIKRYSLNQSNSIITRKTKLAFAKATEKLIASLEVDVTKVATQILQETNAEQ